MIMQEGEIFPKKEDQTENQKQRLIELRDQRKELFTLMDKWYIGYSFLGELTDLQAE